MGNPKQVRQLIHLDVANHDRRFPSSCLHMLSPRHILQRRVLPKPLFVLYLININHSVKKLVFNATKCQMNAVTRGWKNCAKRRQIVLLLHCNIYVKIYQQLYFDLRILFKYTSLFYNSSFQEEIEEL